MLAYTYVERGKFSLLNKPKPVLQDEHDAIVRVTLASICASDLPAQLWHYRRQGCRGFFTPQPCGKRRFIP